MLFISERIINLLKLHNNYCAFVGLALLNLLSLDKLKVKLFQWLITHDVMKTYEGKEVQLRVALTSALDGDEWPVLSPRPL